jgi:hypothetical protein
MEKESRGWKTNQESNGFRADATPKALVDGPDDRTIWKRPPTSGSYMFLLMSLDLSFPIEPQQSLYMYTKGVHTDTLMASIHQSISQ